MIITEGIALRDLLKEIDLQLRLLEAMIQEAQTITEVTILEVPTTTETLTQEALTTQDKTILDRILIKITTVAQTALTLPTEEVAQEVAGQLGAPLLLGTAEELLAEDKLSNISTI